ncbi:hypothetical protein [Flammeovirga sp. SubArs3]|uniref:hypothetical protein n=1 Tax=Flammeovirga sp. SubArs3 TaxID=2995316 RepID=UPI00248C5EEB|nr:hypothetical protein [Flammeovirga sp. SubArs3]
MINHVDFSGLYDVADGDEDFLVSVLMVIEKNLNEFPNQLQTHLDENDTVAFAKKAHKLKSSTAYLKHKDLETLLLFMEDGNGVEITVLQDKLDTFQQVVKVILDDVQQKIDELG